MKKNQGQNRKKKIRIKIKFNEIAFSSRLSPKYIRIVAPSGTSSTAV